MDRKYMTLAQDIASHSLCQRRKVGAVLVSADGKNIIKAINNPFPSKLACNEKGCLRDQYGISSGVQLDVCRCIHSETSVIIQCAKKGISSLGATVYSTHQPCQACAKVLGAAGVKRVVYSKPYADSRAIGLLKQLHIQVVKL